MCWLGLRAPYACSNAVRLAPVPVPPTTQKYPSTVVGRGKLLDVGRVVGRVQRREHPLRDLAADRAEVGDDARRGRPAEAVVVHDDGGVAPTEPLVRDLTDAGVPLRPVAVVAEHVLRRDLQRRILRAGGADDERLGRMRLRVVRDVDRLVTRQRADHDVGPELLHQPPGLLDRGRHRVVAAAVADDPDVLAADLDAGHAGGRLLRVLHLAARVLRERSLCAADVRLVAEAERALAVGHDRDPDLPGAAPDAASDVETATEAAIASTPSGSMSFHRRDETAHTPLPSLVDCRCLPIVLDLPDTSDRSLLSVSLAGTDLATGAPGPPRGGARDSRAGPRGPSARRARRTTMTRKTSPMMVLKLPPILTVSRSSVSQLSRM